MNQFRRSDQASGRPAKKLPKQRRILRNVDRRLAEDGHNQRDHLRAYTPNDIARNYAISVEKILTWIKNGQLRAINLASDKSSRPRWKILPADLVAFENRRAAVPPQKPDRPRKKKTDEVTEFF